MLSVDELVKVVPLNVDDDSRGSLCDVFRSDDEGFITFGQNSVVRSREGAVRGFYFHEFLSNHFTVVKGAAIFWFFALPVPREGYLDEEYPDIEVLLNTIRHRDRTNHWENEFGTYEDLLGVYGERPWYMSVVATGEHPKRIDVPAGVAYGWCALEDDTILLSTGSETYCADDPDEYRLPWDLFGAHIWGIENK
jgi:dTDP-4-dehydrorhamnose 3,5-epimerase-like enzyme